jgi:predicted benzoate:H+ symporter BenE
MKSESFSRWIATGVPSFLGIGLVAGVILRTGFGLPFARVGLPITVLVTIQVAFFIVMYWVRQRYKQTRDLRVGFVVAGIYGLLVRLVGMYYASQLALVNPKAVNENYFGFSVFMVAVIVIGVGLLSFWKPTQFRQ